MNTRSIVRVVAILLLNLSLLYATFSQTAVVVSPASGNVFPLQHYAVSLVVNNVAHLHAAAATVGFDPAILRIDSVKQGPLLVQGGSTFFSVFPAVLGPGVDSAKGDQAILGANGVGGSGTLLTLHFTTLQPGSSSLTVKSIDFRDTVNVKISASPVAGSVTVLTPLLGATVFLEGPYVSATTSMGNNLKIGGALGTHFPGVIIPAYAVDSVNIEIRNNASAAGSTVRRFAPAWILTNGTLRSFNDTTLAGVAFDAPAGAYYVVVRHRNHLAIMSSSTVTLGTSPASYDFTAAMTAAYGANAMKALAGSRYGMFAGDVNSNGQLKYNGAGNDRALILSRIGGTNMNVTVNGYYNEDINLDGVVKYNGAGNDRAIILQNIGGSNMNLTLSTQVPN